MMGYRSGWLVTLVGFVMVSIPPVGLGSQPTTAAPGTGKVNVVMLVLDTLRADHLHSYGNPRSTSPNIDQLAQRGVRFSHYFTVCPWTSPSFASLHTSLYPSRHGVTCQWDPGMPLIDKDTPMLAEILSGHGYYTTAFVNNGLGGRDLTGRGFDEYYEDSAAVINIMERVASVCPPNCPGTAPITTERVLSWLDQHQADRFFLYVHLWEPHSPYNPPAEDDLFKTDAYPYVHFTRHDLVNGPLLPLAMLGDKKAIERLTQLYDGNIHFVDRYVGLIMRHLKSLGLEGKTLVILTSDHGELLYSHPKDFATFGHCSLYEPVLHIPMIMAGPGLPEGEVLDGLASNVDTAPTILDLLGLPALADAQGKSLVPLIEKKTPALNRYLYAETDIDVPERSVRSERYKLILNLWTGEKQLFDLQTDPSELTDIAAKNPAVFRELDAELGKWMQQNQPSREKQRARWSVYAGARRVLVNDNLFVAGVLMLPSGAWHLDTSPTSGDYDGSCFWTEGGDGSRTALFRMEDPLVGAYRISVYFGRPSVGKLASNAPFEVVSETGSNVVRVNFNEGAGEWKLLGTFEDPRYVRLSNAADGVVIADAVKFERID